MSNFFRYGALAFLLSIITQTQASEVPFGVFKSEGLREILPSWGSLQRPNRLSLLSPHLQLRQTPVMQLSHLVVDYTVDYRQYQAENAYLARLPLELQTHIASFLEDPRDVYTLAVSYRVGYAATRDFIVIVSLDDVNRSNFAERQAQYLRAKILIVKLSVMGRVLTVQDMLLLGEYFPNIIELQVENLLLAAIIQKLAHCFAKLKRLVMSGGVSNEASAVLAKINLAQKLRSLTLGNYLLNARDIAYLQRLLIHALAHNNKAELSEILSLIPALMPESTFNQDLSDEPNLFTVTINAAMSDTVTKLDVAKLCRIMRAGK